MTLVGPMTVSGIPSWHFMSSRRRTASSRLTCARRNCLGIRATGASVQLDFNAELREVETVALRLARQAGDIIQEKSGRALQGLELDRLMLNHQGRIWSQKLTRLVNNLLNLGSRRDDRCILGCTCDEAVFPKHLWLGEETVTAAQLENLENGIGGLEWTWIVDPIDGTLNFIGGIPFASVSIAVARGSSVELGVIYNPFVDEMFQATKGHGAFLNGQKISVLPHDTDLEDAIVTLGFPSKPEKRALMLEAINKVGPHCRAVRALGSAALHMSYVAAGRVGCFFEHGLKPWDIAAARLVLEEAGGYVSGMDGKPLPLIGGSILATNGGVLHGRIVQLLS